MPSAPAGADWNHWPGRLAALVNAAGREPGEDALRQAADMGRALAAAGVALTEVVAGPWSLLEQHLRESGGPGEATFESLDGLVQRLTEAYAIATQEAAERSAARLRALEALHCEHDPAQPFLDLAGVIVVALDARGTVTLANKKACAVLGYDAQALIGLSWFDRFVPEGERARVKLVFDALIAGDEVLAERYENSVRTRTGAERLIAWHRALLRDEAGHVVGTLNSGEDITECRAAERELRRHEAQLEELVARRTRELTEVNARLQEELAFTKHVVTGVPAIINRIAPDGTTTFVNPAGERITGYRADEVVGHNWWRTFYPGDEYRQVDRLFEAFQRGDVRDYEMELTTKGGARRTISWNSINRFDAAGQLAEIIGFGEDVTERRQAADVLRESEQQLRLIMDNVPAMIVHIDSSERCRFANRRYEEWRSYRLGSCVGLPLREMVGETIYQLIQPHVAAVLSGQPVHFETLREYAGQPQWIDATHVPDVDGAGNVVGFYALLSDITERKQVERELRVFKTVSDEAGYGSAIVDMEGRIKYVNTAFAAIHGRTAAELLGQSLAIFHSAAQMPRVDALNERLRQGGRYVAEEVWHVRADGSEFPMLMSGIVLRDEQGRPELMAATAMDITEHMRTQAILRASEAQYRLLADHTDDIVSLNNGAGDRLFISPSIERVTGWTPDEARAMDWRELIHADDLPALDAARAANLRGERTRVEYRSRCKNGDWVWLEMKARSVCDAAGQVQQILCASRDITDRKRAEEALWESKEFLDRIINSIADPIFVKDRQHRMVLVNDAECALTGYPRAEVLGKTDAGFFPQEQVDVFWEKDEAVLATGAENINEEAITDARGNTCTIVTKKARYTDKQGAQFLVGVIRDITDRKRAEEALRRSEARFRTLAETIPVAVTITSGPRVLYVNSAAAAITGYERDELLGLESYWDVVHADFRELVRERGEVREQGASVPSRYEIKLLRKGGEERWVELSASYFEFDGVPATLAAGIDITERKQAEEAVRQHQEQLTHVARVATVGEMASGLAHELSQPLAAILYFAQGCSRRLQAGARGTAEALDALQKIAAQAERAGEFIRRLKAFVRKAAPQCVSTDLNAIVHEALTLAAVDMRSKHVAVQLDLAEHLPRVQVDPLQIEQVLLNLIRNAVDAMEPTPVEQRELQIRTHAGPRHTVCVSVRDTGPGLTPEVAEQVFDPFFTTKPLGTGLGLAISRTIIEEAHGGSLWVKPDPRGGASAGFALPIRKRGEHVGK